MRCLSLTGLREMRLTDLPSPRLVNSTDVLLRIGCVGVCGSDMHYYTTGHIGSQKVSYPFVVGHECSGTIEDVGPGVTHLRPGDRVAVDPAMPCHACDQCRADRTHTCRNLRFLGCPNQAGGCLCDYLVMPASSCFVLPDALTMEHGMLLEPLSIGAYAAHLAGSLRDKRVAILGFGPIGISVLLAARAAGAANVYISDPLAYRQMFALQCGATWSGTPEALTETIQMREPLNLDVVFECCGQQAAVDQAVDLLKPGGKLMLIGIPGVDRFSFPMDLLRRHELCIQNVRRQNHCVEAAMQLTETFQDLVDAMITHRFEPQETQAAFDLVSDYSDGVIKAMIRFS